MVPEVIPIEFELDPIVLQILGDLQRKGFEGYVVGGAVRDLLVGRRPKDYDIATDATPRQIKKMFGKKAKIIGRRFRLVHYCVGRDFYEVSTFRREPTAEERRGHEEDDGVQLWRDNQFGTLEEDAQRRDFTVNALYYDPYTRKGIVDYCGGVEDIRNKTVRMVGDSRYRLAEDPVRILRALKLVAQYGFELEEDLANAVAEFNPAIAKAAAARRFEELLKILKKPYSKSTFDVFFRYGFLSHFLPTLAENWSEPQGEYLRAVLDERDKRVANGECSDSRRLALSTVALPVIAQELGEGLSEGLWEHSDGVEQPIRDIADALFEPLTVPKFLSARMRDVLLNLPRFYQTGNRRRLLHHPEYKYSRELLSVLVTACNWDSAVLEDWPYVGKARHVRQKKKRPNRPKKSRSNS